MILIYFKISIKTKGFRSFLVAIFQRKPGEDKWVAWQHVVLWVNPGVLKKKQQKRRRWTMYPGLGVQATVLQTEPLTQFLRAISYFQVWLISDCFTFPAALGLAPLSSSSSATSTLPYLDATCSGVKPFCRGRQSGYGHNVTVSAVNTTWRQETLGLKKASPWSSWSVGHWWDRKSVV